MTFFLHCACAAPLIEPTAQAQSRGNVTKTSSRVTHAHWTPLRMRRRESRYARTHAAHAQNQTAARSQGGACALPTRHLAHAPRRTDSPVLRMRRSAQNNAARSARSPPPPFCGACARLETREPRMRPSERRSTPRRSAQAQCPPPPPPPPSPGGQQRPWEGPFWGGPHPFGFLERAVSPPPPPPRTRGATEATGGGLSVAAALRGGPGRAPLPPVPPSSLGRFRLAAGRRCPNERGASMGANGGRSIPRFSVVSGGFGATL